MSIESSSSKSDVTEISDVSLSSVDNDESKSEKKIEEDENKEEESNGDSYIPKVVVIAAALVVAAGSIYIKCYLKKCENRELKCNDENPKL